MLDNQNNRLGVEKGLFLGFIIPICYALIPFFKVEEDDVETHAFNKFRFLDKDDDSGRIVIILGAIGTIIGCYIPNYYCWKTAKKFVNRKMLDPRVMTI